MDTFGTWELQHSTSDTIVFGVALHLAAEVCAYQAGAGLAERRVYKIVLNV